MKALSIHPDWALMIWGKEKTVEVRSWKTNYRGDLLICSTQQKERDNIRMLKNSEGVDIWINEKYVKYFEDMPIKYYGSGPKNVVYVEAHGCIVGLILPINHK